MDGLVCEGGGDDASDGQHTKDFVSPETRCCENAFQSSFWSSVVLLHVAVVGISQLQDDAIL